MRNAGQHLRSRDRARTVDQGDALMASIDDWRDPRQFGGIPDVSRARERDRFGIVNTAAIPKAL